MEEKELKYCPMTADKKQAIRCRKARKWNLKHRRITERRKHEFLHMANEKRTAPYI
ncbi:hypothetical protein [Cuneatibacter caecimuris]|uniref:Uncharacterized protein n=1 Tax=Cuneatibacter caecimuris TaxID=1796618 RepID=A0A4V2F7T3_9FIRM|nr:hypothetical protein [Cuneatibacter caecimuris]RZT00929.1 hypothetical protein EV209_1365 [Cuneatibacter caecimuris]